MKWQPVGTAPKDKIVLVHDDGYVGKAMQDEKGWLDIECSTEQYFVPAPTEWMPLPEPPEEEV